MKKYIFAAAILSSTLGIATANATDAAPQEGEQTKLGVLSCEVDGGIGLILGSNKGVNCEFTHGDGTVERYTGNIGKLGLDIGITEKSYLKWVVVKWANTPLPAIMSASPRGDPSGWALARTR